MDALRYHLVILAAGTRRGDTAGRSDLDLVALVSMTISDVQRRERKRAHGELIGKVPLADKLHCSYVA